MTKVKPLIEKRRHGHNLTGSVWEPWLTRDSIVLVESLLARFHVSKGVGLEWGAGTSSKWLLERVGFLFSIEHDSKWGPLTKEYVEQFPELLSKWSLQVIPPTREGDKKFVGKGRSRFFEKYSQAKNVPDNINFILVDGRARNACLRTAVKKLIKKNGVLVLDNSDRKRYDHSIVPSNWKKTITSNGVWETTVWVSK